MSIGYRQEQAALRQARLALAQSYITLKDQELRAQRALEAAYREVKAQYKIIQARRAARIAYAEELEGRFKEFISGKAIQQLGGAGVIDFLLTAQSDWTAALSAEYVAIQAYNVALARFEFTKGTILRHDNVVIAEGPLPRCAQVRAVEHERERAKAIVLRERAAAVPYQDCSVDKAKPALPLLPEVGTPSLPALMRWTPPVPAGDLPPAREGVETIPTRPMPAPGPAPGNGPGAVHVPPAAGSGTGQAPAAVTETSFTVPALSPASPLPPALAYGAASPSRADTPDLVPRVSPNGSAAPVTLQLLR